MKIFQFGTQLPKEKFQSINQSWLDGLKEYPITAIETATIKNRSKISSVCICNCIGCSANALLPTKKSYYLNPNTLRFILNFLKLLDFKVLSRKRINLFSGSNELDHPNCIELRQELSKYYKELYKYDLGRVSSDVVFHISRTNEFRRNLVKILKYPSLFDNICMSIDEQIIFKSNEDYKDYMKELSWVWKVLNPIITNKLKHINKEKTKGNRLILNFLLPNSGNSFTDKYSELYPSGLQRAINFEELIRRYVTPFVGEIKYTNELIPKHHVFTTGIASLSMIEKSSVFISKAHFEPVGRAKKVTKNKYNFPIKSLNPTIRTKIYPINDYEFIIRCNLAPSIYSDGILPWKSKPDWVKQLEQLTFRISETTISIN